MGIDTSMLAFPKGQPGVALKRAKRLTDESQEDVARKAVRKRDGRRCAVPGCREDGVHLHHIVYRSKSKKLRWQTSNLCFLCTAHHAWEHAGKITITGNADEELVVKGERKYLAFKV